MTVSSESSRLSRKRMAQRQPQTSSPESLTIQAELCKALMKVSVPDASGVALSYLLYCAHAHPHVLRTLLNEPVVREGFRGTSMLTVLTRVARS